MILNSFLYFQALLTSNHSSNKGPEAKRRFGANDVEDGFDDDAFAEEDYDEDYDDDDW